MAMLIASLPGDIGMIEAWARRGADTSGDGQIRGMSVLRNVGIGVLC